jgi:hypothetical protein
MCVCVSLTQKSLPGKAPASITAPCSVSRETRTRRLWLLPDTELGKHAVEDPLGIDIAGYHGQRPLRQTKFFSGMVKGTRTLADAGNRHCHMVAGALNRTAAPGIQSDDTADRSLRLANLIASPQALFDCATQRRETFARLPGDAQLSV